MEIQSRARSPIDLLRSMSRRVKLTVTMLIVVVVAAILAIQMGQAPVTCELIEGCHLRRNDISRMQVALNQAGLNDFTLIEGNLLVPKKQRDIYLKAVSEQGALPEELCLTQEEPASFNPFMTRIERDNAELAKKKKQIRDMVMRLKFVEQAWLELDRSKARTAFQSDEQTAVIVIQPTKELRLNSDQVATIRSTIAGASIGLKPDSIVVTDLNAGVAYQDLLSPSIVGTPSNDSTSATLSSARLLDKKHRYENQIREALSDLEGLEIWVEIVESTTTTLANRTEMTPTLNRGGGNGLQAIQVGTNGQASVTKPIAKTSAPIEEVSQISDRVHVEIQIPESHLLADISNHTMATLTALRKDHAYRTRLEELTDEIVRRVRPILPIISFASPIDFPIKIAVKQAPINSLLKTETADGTVESLVQRVGGPWGALAIFAGAVLILGFVFSGSSSTTAQAPAPISTESERATIELDPKDDSVKNEISKLIKEDPEAAAQVIKRWIRNAA